MMNNLVDKLPAAFDRKIKVFGKNLFSYMFLLLALGCNSSGEHEDRFDGLDDKIELGADQALKIALSKPQFDSIVYTIGGEVLSVRRDTGAVVIHSEQWGLGAKLVDARIFRDGKEHIVSKEITVVAPAPKEYAFKVIHVYPHDTLAYTQGLEMAGETLYESTGSGDGLVSSVRQVDLKTGAIKARHEYVGQDEIGVPWFIEGLTLVGNKLLLLTWKNNFGTSYLK